MILNELIYQKMAFPLPIWAQYPGNMKASRLLYLLLSLWGASPPWPERACAADRPESNPKSFAFAIAAFQKKRFRESKAALEKLTTADPASSLYWFNLGNACYSLNEYRNAERAYGKVVQLKSKLAPAASLYLARVQRLLDRPERAARTLRPLREQNLPSALAKAVESETAETQTDLLALALAHYREGRSRQAIPLLNAALSLRENMEAELLLGLASVKEASPNEAAKAFSLVKEQSTNPELRNEAGELLAQLGKRAPRRFRPFAGLAAGYNSNVYATGDSGSPTSDPTLQAQLGVDYPLLQKQYAGLSAGYSLLYMEVFQQPAQRAFTHSFSAAAQATAGNWVFRLHPRLDIESLGGDPYLRQWGTSGEMQWSYGKSDLGLRLTAMKLDPGSTYEYLDGFSRAFKPYWTLNLPRGSVTLSYIDSEHHVGDFATATSLLPLAHHTRGVQAAGECDFAPWALAGSFTYQALTFDNKAEPDDLYRADRQYDFFVKVSRRISETLLVFGSDDFLINKSTLGSQNTTNKNYTQNIFLAGLAWEQP
jgi:Flp pilus assembly protein TadD